MSTIGYGTFDLTSLAHQPTPNDYNRYVFDNPADHVSSEKFKEILYKVAAIGSLLLVGVLIVGGLVALVNFAPIAVPFYLILAGAIFKTFHSKVFTLLKQKGELAQQDAQMYAGMAQEIEKVKVAYTDYNSFNTLLRKLGIGAEEIPAEELSQAAQNARLLMPTANLIGRVHYWEKMENETRQKIDDLDEKIATLTPSLDPKKMAEKSQLRREKQQLEEVVLLPAKVAHAYALHVLANVTDQRDFDAFGSCHPLSYESHLEYLADRVPQPYYSFPESSDKPPLSKAEMFELSPLELSKRIFGDSKAFVR